MKKFFLFLILFSSILNAEFFYKRCKPPIGNWPSGLANALDMQGDYLFLGEGGLLSILKISTGHTLVSRLKMPDVITDIMAKDNFLYIACDDTCFVVINIIDPENPILMGITYLNYLIRQIVVDNSLAYLATDNSIVIIDCSNPYYPYILSDFYKVKNYADLVVWNNYLFAARYNSGIIDIFDISNPLNPIFKEEYQYNNFGASNIFVKNDKLYICLRIPWHTYYLGIFSLSEPLQIEYISSIQIDNNSYDLYVNDMYAFISMYNNGMQIIKISDPLNPQHICTWWSQYFWVFPKKTVGTNNRAYIATYAHGLHKTTFYANSCFDSAVYATVLVQRKMDKLNF